MIGGYIGKILFVDLSKGMLKEDTLNKKLCSEFIGGYGIGARIIYNLQKAAVNPLGPENILGFITGPLTGTPAAGGARYTVVAGRSPLTKGWADGNSGGYFGPYLKFAGYDGIFFTGASEKPVYLFIDNGKAELRDASHIWGKGTYETEETLQAELGKTAQISCIGPSGEKLSLLACIVNMKRDAIGRSGLGAVMGSKKLKAVAVRGNQKVPIADGNALDKLRREYLRDLRVGKFKREGREESFFEHRRKYGTAGRTVESARNGDAPIKNWGGVGIVDFPDASGLSGEAVIRNLKKHVGCWHCPLVCKGILKKGMGQYKYPTGTARPEYETQTSFGTLCLNNNTESIAMVTYICDEYGIDTISGGCTIAFAIECYENGIITNTDTEGIDLTWGNHQAIVAMTEKMAKREGFGDILADGTKVAAEKIGKGAEQYAINIGGQELGMHDPKFAALMNPDRPAAARYQMDATPGRHTQGFGPSGFEVHVINAAGLCATCYFVVNSAKYIAGFMKAVTGWDRSMDELLKAGEKIANMRHAFNLREGINPLEWPVHNRIIGRPPQKIGPLAGVTADIEAQNYWNLGAIDWNMITTKPSMRKLRELNLEDVAKELWP